MFTFVFFYKQLYIAIVRYTGTNRSWRPKNLHKHKDQFHNDFYEHNCYIIKIILQVVVVK